MPISNTTLQALQRDLDTCRRENTHRPTATVCLWHQKMNKFLIVFPTSDQGRSNPGLVKGGVEKEERLIAAALRELREEVGIQSHEVYFIAYLNTWNIPCINLRDNKRSKRYYVFLARYDGPQELPINTTELSGYSWVTTQELPGILEILQGIRPKKRAVLREIFSLALQELESGK